jgi:hypothetical protein
MLEERTLVRLKRDRARDGVHAGHLGTVITRYAAEPPVYEVEFLIQEAGTDQSKGDVRLVVLTLPADELTVVEY